VIVYVYVSDCDDVMGHEIVVDVGMGLDRLGEGNIGNVCVVRIWVVW
jgi:hypothetical protein